MTFSVGSRLSLRPLYNWWWTPSVRRNLYTIDDEPLPWEGTFDVILDSQNKAVCIVEITKVSVQPFNQVSAQHAFKEGEGEKSLAYWRQVHEDFLAEWLREAGLTFTPESKVVLEEFRKFYPL